MSQWTHINGNFRFDHLPISSDIGIEKELKLVFGRISTFEDDWDADGIPTGSEGSIEYDIHKTPRGYDVSVWGDLRDFGDEDVREIVDWFDKIIKYKFKTPFFVRDALLEIGVESGKTYILRDWRDDKYDITYKMDEIESENY